MKIDAVLARYPWPWRVRQHPIMGFWSVVCAAGKVVFDENEMKRATCDAILELVEAHVRAKSKGEASEEVKK